jgi:hypothetical protein
LFFHFVEEEKGVMLVDGAMVGKLGRKEGKGED